MMRIFSPTGGILAVCFALGTALPCLSFEFEEEEIPDACDAGKEGFFALRPPANFEY